MYYSDMDLETGWTDAGVRAYSGRVIWRYEPQGNGHSLWLVQGAGDPESLRMAFDHGSRIVSRDEARQLHDAIDERLNGGPAVVCDLPLLSELIDYADAHPALPRRDAEGLRDSLEIWLEHGDETVPYDLPWKITIVGDDGEDLEPEEEDEYWEEYLKDHRSPYLDEDLIPIGMDRAEVESLYRDCEYLDETYGIIRILHAAARLCDAGRVLVKFERRLHISDEVTAYVVWDRDADYRDMAKFEDVSEALGYRGRMFSSKKSLGIPVEGRCEVITAYVRPDEDDEYEW